MASWPKAAKTKGKTRVCLSQRDDGSAQESNLPKTAELPRTDFEDRGWHQPTERFHSLFYCVSISGQDLIRRSVRVGRALRESSHDGGLAGGPPGVFPLREKTWADCSAPHTPRFGLVAS